MQKFSAFFSQCGNIITSRLLVNPTSGQPKGDGFIRFDQRHEADLAVRKLNNCLPTADAIEPLTVKFANHIDPKHFQQTQVIIQANSIVTTPDAKCLIAPQLKPQPTGFISTFQPIAIPFTPIIGILFNLFFFKFFETCYV